MANKKVGDTEAIRVYASKEGKHRGMMAWRVLPPKSVEALFNKDFPKGAWATSADELGEIIVHITKWKFASKTKVGRSKK